MSKQSWLPDIVALLFLVVAGSLLLAATRAQEPDVIIGGQDDKWVHVKHESGAEYLVRGDTIVGFCQHKPEPAQRNEVWLLSGRVIKTTMPISEFKALTIGADDE